MTAVGDGAHLVAVALAAPVVAADPDVPTVLHAATMEAVVAGWAARRFESACGRAGLMLCGTDGTPAPWPPRVASLPRDWQRCVECHRVTGRRRPRSVFVKR